MLRAERGYGSEVDVYSFGVVMAEILTKLQAEDIPRTNDMVVDVIAVSKIAPTNAPIGFLPLMISCCKNNPQERPTFKNIIRSFERMKIVSRPGNSAPIARKRLLRNIT